MDSFERHLLAALLSAGVLFPVLFGVGVWVIYPMPHDVRMFWLAVISITCFIAALLIAFVAAATLARFDERS